MKEVIVAANTKSSLLISLPKLCLLGILHRRSLRAKLTQEPFMGMSAGQAIALVKPTEIVSGGEYLICLNLTARMNHIYDNQS